MKRDDILFIHLRVQLDIVDDLIKHGVKDPHVLRKEIKRLHEYANAYNLECRKTNPTMCIKEVNLNE